MSAEAPLPEPGLLLLDTHALLWVVSNQPRLGRQTAKAIDLASRQNRLAVSAITPWEIGLLDSKKRITLHKEPLAWIREVLAQPGCLLYTSRCV